MRKLSGNEWGYHPIHSGSAALEYVPLAKRHEGAIDEHEVLWAVVAEVVEEANLRARVESRVQQRVEVLLAAVVAKVRASAGERVRERMTRATARRMHSKFVD